MSKKNIFRVLILNRDSLVAPGVPSLSVATRLLEVLDYLATEIPIEYCSVSENDAFVEGAIEWASVVMLSKHRSAKALHLVRLARRLGKSIVYDIDDWIFSFPGYSGGASGVFDDFTREIIAECDCVTVSNQVLMERLPSVVQKESLVFLPNGMWVERYKNKFQGANSRSLPPRVVFTNADFLKVEKSKDAILNALNVFFMRHPDWTLDFYGDPFPEMFSLSFMHFINRIPYQRYMQAIISGDYAFAITPLGAEEDIESVAFNNCKNPFKFLNYGVAKIPGIYSSSKIYRDCIEDGKSGLLVENKFGSWLDAMECYAASSKLRHAVSNMAYEVVNRDFHVRDGAYILKNIIENIQR